MASIRIIKRKIKSVNNTRQITKAMNLVATSKLQKSKNKLMASRPYLENMKDIINSICSNSTLFKKSKFFNNMTDEKSKKVGIILISGDRGLCGGYNVNVCKLALKKLDQKNEAMYIVGSKGLDYFKRRNKNIIESFTGLSDDPHIEHTNKIAELAIKNYLDGTISELHLVYTEFNSIVSQVPTSVKLLPLSIDNFKIDNFKMDNFKMDNFKMDNSEKNIEKNVENKKYSTGTYEPSEESLLNLLIPKFIGGYIFVALNESYTCELGSRMTAMDSASKNAKEMISKLKLQYNRARQGAITQEINEIVSGSNAMS